MTAQLIIGASVFDELAQEWDELAGHGMTDTPFQSLAYQRAWWQHLQPVDSELYSVIVRDDQERLIGLACLYLFNGALFFNGCVEETDYLDLIASEENAEAVWSAVFKCLVDPGFPKWKALDLCNVPEGSATHTLLPEIAERFGCSTKTVIHEVCPIIALPATFDVYLDELPKKQRHEIRRKLRRANGAGAVVSTISADDDLPQAVDAFLELLQKSTIEKQGWLNDGRRALFHDTAQAAMAAGTLQLMFVEIEGHKAAALFNFKYRDRIWVYNSGLDPQLFGNLSLGVVVTSKSIEAGIEQGYTSFDFLRGNETYKYRFGAVDTNVYRIHVAKDD